MALRVYKEKKGIALLYSLFVLLLIGIIGFGVVNLFILDSRSCTQNIASTKASYLAQSGIARAMAHLSSDSLWGTSEPVTMTLGEGQYTVSVNPGPGGAISGLWRVSSVGRIGSTRVQIVAWVARESFAQFAYFSNYEKTPQGVPLWFTSFDRFNGPVHTNSFFSINGNPQFSDKVTSSNKDDNCYNSTTRIYRQGGRNYTDPAKFYHYQSGYNVDYPMALNGSSRFSFAGGKPEVFMPPNINDVRDSATYVYNTDVDIVLNNDGTNGTMNITYKQGGQTRTDTISTASTIVWINGTVNSLYGNLIGDCTIASSEDIYITSDILYADKTRDKLSLSATQNIYVKTDKDTQKDIEIDAAIFALNGSFGVDNYTQGNYRGVLTVFGSISQQRRGAVGTLNPGQNTIKSGYAKNYIFDSRFSSNPPRGHPKANTLVIKSWQDNRTLSH